MVWAAIFVHDIIAIFVHFCYPHNAVGADGGAAYEALVIRVGGAIAVAHAII